MEQDSIAIEVFVSDNGDPLLFTILMKLPQRRIMEARVETLPKNISGVPEYFSQDLSALKDIEINEGFLKNSREALQDKLTLKLLFDAFIENARICCRPYQKISLLEEVSIGRDFRKKVIDVGGGEKDCVHFVDFIMDMVRYHKQVCEVAGLAA